MTYHCSPGHLWQGSLVSLPVGTSLLEVFASAAIYGAGDLW